MEQAEIAMTFGGIPSYLELINPKESFAQNLNRLALTKDCYFINEVQFILREQLKNPSRYYLILRHLAENSMTREELAKATGVENSGALNLYLKTLTDLHLIKPQISMTKTESSKQIKYILWDEYLRFYFYFIGPHNEQIQLNADDWLFDKIILPHWPVYCGHSFELFCRKNLGKIINILGIGQVFLKSGTFWQNATQKKEGVQIDLIIERSDETTHLVECKWSSGKIGTAILDELERKKKLFPNKKNHTLKTVLITTYGVTEPVLESKTIDDIIAIKDIFGTH